MTVILKLPTPTRFLSLGSRLQIKDKTCECLTALYSCASTIRKVLRFLKAALV